MGIQMSILNYSLQRCDNLITTQIVEMLKASRPIKEIEVELALNSYVLGDYLVAAFNKADINPAKYMDKNDFKDIQNALAVFAFPTRKAIKEHLEKEHQRPYSYESINIAMGVYFRRNRYFNNKNVIDNKIVKPVEKSKNDVAQVSFIETKIDPNAKKINLNHIPVLKKIINELKTERWKKFACDLFSKKCPKQFFIMPATMGTFAHDITELTYGKFNEENPEILERMGGKCFHSIRVFENICRIIETDSEEVTNYAKRVESYVYGNAYKDWEEDMMKVAALSHDIYSGGIEDEFNFKRKSLDKAHPYYHREELADIATCLPTEEWDVFLTCVENHMWKWSLKEGTIFFDDGKKTSPEFKDNFYQLYRLVKNLQISDYFAAQRDSTNAKEIIFSINAYFKLFGDYNLTEDVLNKLNINSIALKKAFGHDDLTEIIRICEKIKGKTE